MLDILFYFVLYSYLTRAFALVEVVDSTHNITYIVGSTNGVDSFSNIQCGQDACGQWRFKPPRAYIYPTFTIANAAVLGVACPQATGQTLFGYPASGGVYELSEDCLNLRVARPSGITSGDLFPVMVWIYGGRKSKRVETDVD